MPLVCTSAMIHTRDAETHPPALSITASPKPRLLLYAHVRLDEFRHWKTTLAPTSPHSQRERMRGGFPESFESWAIASAIRWYSRRTTYSGQHRRAKAQQSTVCTHCQRFLDGLCHRKGLQES